jgi:hypothetical protein
VILISAASFLRDVLPIANSSEKFWLKHSESSVHSYWISLPHPPERLTWHGMDGLLSVGFTVFLFAMTTIAADMGFRQEPKMK